MTIQLYIWEFPMKKILCSLFRLIFLFLSLFYPSMGTLGQGASLSSFMTPGQYGKGYRYNIQGWIYVHIEGDPYERGFQHGYLLSDEIVDLITRWSNMIHNQPQIKPITSHFSQDRYEHFSNRWWDFCVKQCVQFYGDKYPEEYRQEIQGIADGVNHAGGKIFGRNLTVDDILTSNEMYEYLSKITLTQRGIHPLKTFFDSIRHDTPELSTLSTDQFLDAFATLPEAPHHCDGFIATGNATTHGQIVISNSMWSSSTGSGLWWWSYYITFRWNIILDIQPTQGNRIILASAPGYIWSDHDFYQNDAGIVLLETTLPQGPWDLRGLPLAVRVRTAMQYGKSIDDVTHYLSDKNDGGMDAVWLIGDTKTGEIARFELSLRHSALYRTFNGFYWSCNNPMDLGVRLDNLNLRMMIKRVLAYVLSKSGGYEYFTPRYHPSDRDLKFDELGKKYYGNIDVDVVKEIMSTQPIVRHSPDCKLTDSDLVAHNGLWVFLGNPNDSILDLQNLDHPSVNTEKIPPLGWVKLYGLPKKENYTLVQQKQNITTQPSVLWMYNTTNNTNDFSSAGVLKDDVLFMATSTGELLALSAQNGSFLWNRTIGEYPTAPTLDGQHLYIGTMEGITVVNTTGEILWKKSLGKIVSRPVIWNNTVFIGDDEGHLYALEKESGAEQWHIGLPNEIYLSEPWNGTVIVTSGKNCSAIDCETGGLHWMFPTDEMITARSYINNGVVYFGSWDTFVYAVNASTGDLIWKYETGWGIDTIPVITDTTVFVGSTDQNMYALNRENGSLQWIYTTKAAIHSSPIISGNVIVFGSDDGRLYLANSSTGENKWCFAPGFTIDDNPKNYITTPIISSPVTDENTVYIGVKGVLYALTL